MIRGLLKLGAILIVGILIYNYFFGSPEEKTQSKEIFHKVGELGKAGINLLKTEKGKFDEGKYDEALDNIGGLFQKLKKKAEDINDSELLDKLADLEKTREGLADKLDEDKSENFSEKEKGALKDELRKFMNDTESLMKKIEDEER
ncbi:MAG: hypothetical protein DHS20C18_51730 [Saprospiraceae bacterium]|nr:MAG: hypothetical protein DHS20C18_51730 [Saprospiraceae bacterium]